VGEVSDALEKVYGRHRADTQKVTGVYAAAYDSAEGWEQLKTEIADFATAPDGSSLGRAVVSLTQAAQWAAGFGVRLALEFRGGDAFCSCLDTALTLVEQCREPNVGVCLDLFHYYKGPSKPEDLDRLTAANLFHVQVCDVAGVPRELMTDADRVFPGEGDFRPEPVLGRLKEISYAGAVSLELMNPTLWGLKGSQVVELGLTALRRMLG
ncbi:MAG: TIM barrel protein, partial [Gemmataceae bacterium]|nr:TIM barrel protein [Gemmataceae bacterium]